MNERLGRIGLQEGTAVASLALTVGGIFSFETKTLYERGNSAYITLPLAALASLALFILTTEIMKRKGAGNLFELFKLAFGRFSSVAAGFLVMLFLVSAYAPLSRFIMAMHSLFFDGVSYTRIALFVMPTVFMVVLMGFETLARTAKLYSVPLFLMLVISIAGSQSEFELYRLYPLFGNGAKAIIVQILEGIGTFLPPLLALLVTADGLNGVDTAKKAGLIAALISVAICFVSQLALALVYPYSQLSELFMPLFRINYLNKFEAHLMRMDKLAHIMWLNGGMLAGALYIYCGSRLFLQLFELRDIRPAILTSTVLTLILILIEVETRNAQAFSVFKSFYIRFGWLAAAAPPLLASVFAGLVKKRNTDELKNGNTKTI